MTDLGFLTEFMVPVIVGICLCVGYVVKKWIKDVDNKYIPTICAVLGVLLAIWINGWTITASILLSGLFSGLASTGLHQLFKQYIEKKEGIKEWFINVHAGHNPDGKVACGSYQESSRESTEARNVKNEVYRQLKSLGHTVYDCTVDNGTSANNVLCNIVGKCNSHAADLDVSIHFNAGAKDMSGNGRTTGVEAYIYSDNSKAKPFAEKIVKAIAALGFKNRGVKINKKLYVLNHTKAPAMLIECCFVDDKDDVALYDFKSMASAIVYGITGQQYIEPSNNTSDDDAATSGSETSVGDKDSIYRVQVGAYRNKANAISLQEKLKAAGFDAAIVKA